MATPHNIDNLQPIQTSTTGALRPHQVVFNPSAAVMLNLFGYYSFAPFSERFLPDSSLGGIIILGFIAMYSIATYALNRSRLVPKYKTYMVFAYIFMALYGMRLLIETFIDGTVYPSANEVVLLYFIVNTVMLVPIVSSMSWKFTDRSIVNAAFVLCIVYLIGMALNLSVLLETLDRRFNLTKVNPIVMAHLAVSYMIFCFVFFKHSSRMKSFSLMTFPILFLIFVYARSRGAYIAFVLVIMFYLLAQRGQRRIFLLIGAAFVGLIALSVINQDIQDVIFSRLIFTLSGEDQSTNIRVLLIKESLAFFWEHPFIGKSILDPVNNFYPHNFLLESLISTGIIGTIFLIAHLSLSLRAAFNIIRSNVFPKFAEFISLVFIQILFANFVSGSVWGASALMMLSCVLLCIYYGRVKMA